MKNRWNKCLGLAALAIIEIGLCGQAQGQEAKARVFYNAKVFTAEPEHPYAEAVGLRGDKIVAVGTRAEVSQAVGKNAEFVDLQGKTLLPGLIAGHQGALDYGWGKNRMERLARKQKPALNNFATREEAKGKPSIRHSRTQGQRSFKTD